MFFIQMEESLHVIKGLSTDDWIIYAQRCLQMQRKKT